CGDRVADTALLAVGRDHHDAPVHLDGLGEGPEPVRVDAIVVRNEDERHGRHRARGACHQGGDAASTASPPRPPEEAGRADLNGRPLAPQASALRGGAPPGRGATLGGSAAGGQGGDGISPPAVRSTIRAPEDSVSARSWPACRLVLWRSFVCRASRPERRTCSAPPDWGP